MFLDDLWGGVSNVGKLFTDFATNAELQSAFNTLSLAATLGMAITKYSAGNKAADRLAESIEESRQQNVAAAAERDAQWQADNREKMGERARQAMIERARIRAIAAESGAVGITGDRLVNEPMFGLGQDIATMQANAAAHSRQYAREVASLNARAQSQRNQIVRPSLWELGGTALGGALDYGRRNSAINPQSVLLQRKLWDFT